MQYPELSKTLFKYDSIFHKYIKDIQDNLINCLEQESIDEITKSEINYILYFLGQNNYNRAMQSLHKLSHGLNESKYNYAEYNKKLYEKENIKYVMTREQYNNILMDYNTLPEDYIIALAKKNINYDDMTINLNHIIYNTRRDIFLFDGKFKIYYTLNDTIVKSIKDFMLDDSKKFIALNDLSIYKTTCISLHRCRDVMLPAEN